MTLKLKDFSDWDQWLDACLTPVGKEGIGEDPRYSDGFSALKAEVEKRQGVDFDQIMVLATEVLTGEAKDLRAAGYFSLAASRIYGLEGFYHSLRLIIGLLETFDPPCHPQKPKARVSAINWLQQPRILAFIQGAEQQPAPELYKQCEETFADLVKVTKEAGMEGFGWPDLSRWLAKNKPAESAPAADQPGAGESQSSKEQAAPPSPSPASTPAMDAGQSIGSDTQLLQVQKQLLGHYRDKQLYGTYVGLARAAKWGDLKLPPNEGGKTRVPAPREASLNAVRVACDNEDWSAAFLAAEAAFFEPGGAFCIELQRHSAIAAQKAGYRSAAISIEHLVRSLFERLPKLKQLSFDNGDPFVSGAALGWLEQISQASQGEEGDGEGRNLLAEARQMRDEHDLKTALQWLKGQGAGPGLDGKRIGLLQAQICHEAGEAALAAPLLERLDESVRQLGLGDLVPDLAMNIWRQRWLVLKDLKAEADADTQLKLDSDIADLQSRMCATDLARAVEWF